MELKINIALWAKMVAFKIVIDITRLNIVFGLDIILSIKFSIQTLYVAKKLGWLSHEFSHLLTKLKKLNEFWLCVVIGMYPKKTQTQEIS